MHSDTPGHRLPGRAPTGSKAYRFVPVPGRLGRAHRRCPRQGVWAMTREERAVEIVRHLASIRPPVQGSGPDLYWCGLCGEHLLDPDDVHDPALHADECPWRRASEWVDDGTVRDETGLCSRRHPATREPLCTVVLNLGSVTPVDVAAYRTCDGCNGNGTWTTRKQGAE